MANKTAANLKAIYIPGLKEPLRLELPPNIAALREKAFELQHKNNSDSFFIYPLPEIALADAAVWSAHRENEDWQIFKARKFAARMAAILISLDKDERIIGKPLRRYTSDKEKKLLETAKKTLKSMPPWPGGDECHFHPDYEKIFRVGIGGILKEINQYLVSDHISKEKHVFYEACRIAMEGFQAFIQRYAKGCMAMAEKDRSHADTWRKLAKICHHIATKPPETFHQAIQFMNLIAFACWFGQDAALTCYGRMDQTLYRFYQADLAGGRITAQEAFELICCLYINQNQWHRLGSAIAVMVGGLDHKGNDLTNDLTYLCMAARQATRLCYPTVALAWHRNTPEELMKFSINMLASGIGDPAFFNTELIAEGLREHGVSIADSYNFMNSTCVEIKVVGASNIWVARPYINCPGALLEVIQAEVDKEMSPAETYDVFTKRVRACLACKIQTAAENLDKIWQQRTVTGICPFFSCLTRDCLERGLDFDRGGARYHWVENSWVGLANLADSMIAIKRLVYKNKEITLLELWTILKNNFKDNEDLRQKIINTLPKYGNDNDEIDDMAKKWAEFLIQTTESNTVGGHRYVPGFFCYIVHELFGSKTIATPDGRLAGTALADGAGPAQGREKRGPTAGVLSTTKWHHGKGLGGIVYNVKFNNSFFKTATDRQAVRNLIETYLERGGFEIQVNVVSATTMRAAQKNPELYQDLLVRVAGYSDYFVHLNKGMQEEIIKRTEFF